MKNNIASLLFLSALLAPCLFAVPGTPIGGIVVKGGKNPGGAMSVRATTNADGRFTITFAEAGEYRLMMGGAAPKNGYQLDYSLNPPGSAARTAPAHAHIPSGEVIITVPAGGGTISGVLTSAGGDKGSADGKKTPAKPAKGGFTQKSKSD